MLLLSLLLRQLSTLEVIQPGTTAHIQFLWKELLMILQSVSLVYDNTACNLAYNDTNTTVEICAEFPRYLKEDTV